MRTIALMFSLIGIISCSQLENQGQSAHFFSGNRWTFIKKENNSIENYAEIEFNENSTLVIHSEIDGRIGPFHYRESDSTLTFNNVTFSIIFNINGSLILKNGNEEYILYKIPFNEKTFDTNQIDPFYLRRCYFLVNLNIITINDAINYLSNIVAIPKDSIPKQEIIFSNNK